MTRAFTFFNADAAALPDELERAGWHTAITSFPEFRSAFLKINKKRDLLQKTHDALKPGGSFIIYQVTNELKQHATFFDAGGVGIFPAEYSADVHHCFS